MKQAVQDAQNPPDRRKITGKTIYRRDFIFSFGRIIGRASSVCDFY